MSADERTELLNFVVGLKKESLADVVTDLRNPLFSLDVYKSLTKEDWKDMYGFAGIFVYRHLNPGTFT